MNDILEQGKTIDQCMQRVEELLASRREASDRIFHTLQASYTFFQIQNTTQSLTFNVPEGHDFEATRLQIYPEVRAVATDPVTQGPSDKTFRPTGWFSDLVNALGYGFPNCAVEAQIELAYSTRDGKSHPYQNAAWMAAQTFSGAANTVPLNTVIAGNNGPSIWAGPYNRFETPGGLVFDPFWRLAAGTAMVAKITPLFSGPRQAVGTVGIAATDGRIYEYRIRGCLEGYKRVRK